jgi:hypothetical protein
MSAFPTSTLTLFPANVDPSDRPPGVTEPRARARRIGWLIVAMTLMGAADLLCTLTYMRTSGMLEANPIARFVLLAGSAEQLVMFKVLMMLLSCGTLYLARRHRKAEACAWVCTAMMFLLTLHWINFNRSISSFTNDMAVLAMSDGEFEPMWVKLD